MLLRFRLMLKESIKVVRSITLMEGTSISPLWMLCRAIGKSSIIRPMNCCKNIIPSKQ